MPYEELVKALRGCVLSKPCDACPYYDPNGPTKECATINIAAADAIEELQGRAKVLEKVADKWCEAVPKWIPVTEQLPEEAGKYLVCGRWREKQTEIWVCEFITLGRLKGWANYAANPPVTYWMPLPESPKE